VAGVDETEGRPRRKRRAQPGDQSEPKRGFYRRYFEALEANDLDLLLSDGLEDEISMMRVVTRRVLKLSRGVTNLDEAITILGALGDASTRLAGLLKTQKTLGSEKTDEVTAALNQALNDVIKELGIE
jgi:hypothetical protein